MTVLSTDPLAPTGAEGATYLSDVNSKHRRPRVTVPKVEIQTPTVEVGRRLRVPPRSQVVSRHQLRYMDDIPWSLQTSFYPMEFITKGATRLLYGEDIVEGTVLYIAEVLDIKQVGYRDWITARSPDVNEQSVLWTGTRCHRFRNFPYRLRPVGNPAARDGHGFPDRPQSVHHQRRGRTRPSYEADRGNESA